MGNWCWTFDPRVAVDGGLAFMPFDPYPRQLDWLAWMDERLRKRDEGLVETSRDVGFSWLSGGFALHKWLFVPGFKTTFGSRKEEYVDKSGDPDSLLEKVRMMFFQLPKWMWPKGFTAGKCFNYMRLINPENGNIIRGEAGDQMGRGGRSTMYFIDEAAFIERADRVNASTSANVDVRIWGSTVNSPGDLFARKRHRLPPEQVFIFDYRDNPLMTPERIARKKAELEDFQWASEYERDYSASVEGICIPAKWVNAAKRLASLVQIEPAVSGVAGGDVGAGKAKSVWVPRWGPVVGVSVSWSEADTINTAHKLLNESRDAKTWRSDGTECRIHHMRYESVGVGQGVASVLARSEVQGVTSEGVNVGIPPTDMIWPDGESSVEKFANLKAEAWWTARERFKHTYQHVRFLEGEEDGIEHELSGLISVPDDRAGPEASLLTMQISLVTWQRNEKGKIAIESKDALRARGIASPDHADALMLTFAGSMMLDLWAQLA
jgi:hypothetical protein